MVDELMSLSEAAKVMRCSYSKAQRLAKSGALPFRRLGANWVIPRSVLFRELGLEVGYDASEQREPGEL
ncbi:MAG: helix-turn-helix domain-containing protein [Eggerthellaceae bacterium]|nr:helix-turn-helix domain-containing protein [Eggerthellaceae bacterium]